MASDTTWFRDAGWGVFAHWLGQQGETAAAWQARVDGFDAGALADQVASTGARYLFLTVGQNSGHWCAPNATYDGLVGIEPSKCSRRDLVADVADALAAHGIRLLAYAPSGAPAADKVACERLEWRWGYAGDGWPHAQRVDGVPVRTGERLAAFQRRWQAVVREWGERWGRRVHGWWVDGCYFADEMYRHAEEPNFASFAAALRAGNPDRIVAFNPGVKVPVICHTEHEDYTAGEIAGALPAHRAGEPPDGAVGGAQYHILSYLGQTWCQGPPRFPDELVVGYTKHVVGRGGVVTWDVPIDREGALEAPFVEQLRRLGRAMGNV